jgi:hypothetical protein
MIPRIARLGAAGVLAVGAGVAGVASASATSGATPTASATATPPPQTRQAHSQHRGGMLRRALHGEFVVRQKAGFTTMAVQRGVITELSVTSLTVRSLDGYSHAYAINDSTSLRAKGQATNRDALQTGERAVVMALKTGNRYTATRISGIRAAAASGNSPKPGGPPSPGSTSSG